MEAHENIGYYILVEGNLNGKKSYHFITSSNYQWFDFFSEIDNEYDEPLKQKLDFYFNSLNDDEEDNEEDEIYDTPAFSFIYF